MVEVPAPAVGLTLLAATSSTGGGTTATYGASAIAPGALPELHASFIMAVNLPIAASKVSTVVAEAAGA